MKLGDTVRVDYFGTEVVGVLSSYDHSGGVCVDLEPPVSIMGVERDGVYLAPNQRARMTLVTSAAEPGDVRTFPDGVIGGAYIPRAAKVAA